MPRIQCDPANPASPANALNGQENTPIFLKVVSLSGIGGSADVWRAKIPPRVAPVPVQTASGAQPLAPSLPAISCRLVPLDAPWVDGARYREAGATDARNRLDLYVADISGPWVRRHGVLMLYKALEAVV
jgi:hypothetical protein